MAHIQIQFLNESTVVSDEELTPIINALQVQVDRDFEPVWGVGAKLNQLPKDGKPDESQWWMVILDTSDQADALGYHDLTSKAQPLGKVFAKSDIDDKCSVSVTISHELLEMLGDPLINDLAINTDGTRAYAKENCDACESDQLGYRIDDVLVSDFVYPAWFCDAPGQASDTQYDHLRHIREPYEILPGGYISYLDLKNPQNGWQEITRDGHNVAARKATGSRYDRRKRFRGRGKRILSSPHLIAPKAPALPAAE